MNRFHSIKLSSVDEELLLTDEDGTNLLYTQI